MSDKFKLDGTEKVENQPFDAHDKVLRASEYKYQEYPKAVDHVEGVYGQLEPVIAKNESEE